MEITIYMIKCNDENIKDTYIGSTKDFKSRFIKHKSNCNNIKSEKYNLKVYKFIRDNGGFNNWNMIKLEEFITDNNQEKLKKEKYYIKLYESNLNSYSPLRTIEEYKEWYEDNKEQIKEQKKEWYEDNKEKRKKQNKEWYENNKEKIKEHKKEYYEKNKEKLKEYYETNKKYREDNKEQISEKGKEKIKCDCGSIIRKDSLKRHKKTKKHLNLMLEINI